jgi:hypothetical protein
LLSISGVCRETSGDMKWKNSRLGWRMQMPCQSWKEKIRSQVHFLSPDRYCRGTVEWFAVLRKDFWHFRCWIADLLIDKAAYNPNRRQYSGIALYDQENFIMGVGHAKYFQVGNILSVGFITRQPRVQFSSNR